MRTPHERVPAGRDGQRRPPAAMLAVERARPFSDPAWLFEVKWDGFRCLTAGGRLYSRRGLDLTARFPEVAAAVPADCMLDGELVVPRNGRPDFDAALDRLRLARPQAVAHASRDCPALLLAFDLLAHRDGPIGGLPLEERRARLLAEVEPGTHLRVNAAVRGDGDGLWGLVQRAGWEGVVAKRLAAPYEPGRRSPAWQKVKNRRQADAWIVGARADGCVIVADAAATGRPIGPVAAGVPPGLAAAIRSGEVPLPLPCRLTHCGVTYRGRLREPAIHRVAWSGPAG